MRHAPNFNSFGTIFPLVKTSPNIRGFGRYYLEFYVLLLVTRSVAKKK